MSHKDVVEDLFDIAGIKLNGKNPWDVQVKNSKLYKRLISQGSLGFGEAYMDGWWDVKSVDQLCFRILRSNTEKNKKVIMNLKNFVYILHANLMNMQTKTRSLKVGKIHYDVGNKLYKLMLGKHMAYSCGYWKNAKNLDEAQEAKLDLICKKLKLKPGMKVLDIGCGWGTFAKFAAERYKVEVVGITISKEQLKYAKEHCKGLPVEIKLQDYRNVKGQFDRILSIGMFEHIGNKNYRVYMEIVHKHLKEDGISLLHTIGANISSKTIDPWLNKYIFPNAVMPSMKQISTAAEGLFVMEDWHNFGLDYDKTLMAWFKNFDKNWDKLKNDYDERFYRIWKYYLLSCAAGFRARTINLWQIVLTKRGLLEGYESVR
ncbi:cyclopropane-fatty-acyl-phospholipid synthase [bacterium]|nr:cyclopropane-fatty-acyl-phospholipid synthase [bacterium]